MWDHGLEGLQGKMGGRMFDAPQDKLEQKRHFQAAGVPVADFMGVEDAAAAQSAAQAYGFPFFLKSRR